LIILYTHVHIQEDPESDNPYHCHTLQKNTKYLFKCIHVAIVEHGKHAVFSVTMRGLQVVPTVCKHSKCEHGFFTSGIHVHCSTLFYV